MSQTKARKPAFYISPLKNNISGALELTVNLKYKNIGIVADKSKNAQEALKALKKKYDLTKLSEAPNDAKYCQNVDVIIALGGDGFMLHTLHYYMDCGIPIYGMNRGTVGFLMNEYKEDDLSERLENAGDNIIHPLKMTAACKDGKIHEELAVNEVSLLRQTKQAAKIKVIIDGNEQIEEMVCDGVLVATPAGSSAYNFSTGGPILPIKSNLLALTPISPFRPRRWGGALLPKSACIRFEVQKQHKRPVNAVADFFEVEDVSYVEIQEDTSKRIHLLFDKGHSLEERILREQFTL